MLIWDDKTLWNIIYLSVKVSLYLILFYVISVILNLYEDGSRQLPKHVRVILCLNNIQCVVAFSSHFPKSK